MALNNVDLNKIRCFQAVAEKGSLLDGARSLNLTTSAVYQSVKKLEEELGKHLFFRSGKKYVLTDEGRSLQGLFQRFLWDLSEFQEHASSDLSESLEGEIRVGLPLNFSKAHFIPIMTAFCGLYPRVRFHLTIAETRRLVNQITAFELDFAITDDAIPKELQSKIIREEVFNEELLLICSREFSKEFKKALQSTKTMRELTHLDYAKNLPLIQRWYKLQYKRQVKITDFHVVDNVETMLAALHAGLGMGIVPKTILSKELERDLEIVPGPGVLSNQLFLIQEGNYINNNLLKKFITFFKEELKTH